MSIALCYLESPNFTTYCISGIKSTESNTDSWIREKQSHIKVVCQLLNTNHMQITTNYILWFVGCFPTIVQIENIEKSRVCVRTWTWYHKPPIFCPCFCLCIQLLDYFRSSSSLGCETYKKTDQRASVGIKALGLHAIEPGSIHNAKWSPKHHWEWVLSTELELPHSITRCGQDT